MRVCHCCRVSKALEQQIPEGFLMRLLLLFVLSMGLVAAASVPARAQVYVDHTMLRDSDYRCYGSDGTIKDALKKNDLDLAAFAASGQGVCELDGRKGGGNYKKQDVPKAILYFQKSMGWGGHSSEPGYIGYRFLGQGFPAVPANREMADYWLHKAVTQLHDVTAQYNLGLAYLKGDVLPKDDKQAVENLTAAVKRSDPHAAQLLSDLYREGKVVPQNIDLADSLSAMVPVFLARENQELSDKQASADNLERQLAQIRADSHAAMMNTLTQGIANLAVQASTPNAMTTATNQQISNINATAANVQAAQQRRLAEAQEKLNQALAREAAKTNPGGSTSPSSDLKAKQSGVDVASVEVPTYRASAPGGGLPMKTAVSGVTAVPAGPLSSCRGMGYSMHFESRWTDARKTEVVGFFTNNSISDATCTWAFHKNGIWTEPGQGTFKAGEKHKGGEMGGVWTVGADSSTIQYVCFEGIDPVDEHGRSCNANVKFSGMTNAGTDR